MKKVGRPRKNREQPLWMLERDTAAVFAYGNARNAGEKHSVAISEAVAFIRTTYPWMPVSETEVKRIVSHWRSKGSATCLFVSKPHPAQSIDLVLGRDGKPTYPRILYTASFGPRPIYARANAASKPGQESHNPGC